MNKRKVAQYLLPVFFLILPFVISHILWIVPSNLYSNCHTGGKECFVWYEMFPLILTPPLFGLYFIGFSQFFLKGRVQKIVTALAIIPLFLIITLITFLIVTGLTGTR